MIFLLQTSSSGLEKKPIVAIVEIMYWALGRLKWSVIDKAFFWRKHRHGKDSATAVFKTLTTFKQLSVNSAVHYTGKQISCKKHS